MPIPTWYVFEVSDNDARFCGGWRAAPDPDHKASRRIRFDQVAAYHYEPSERRTRIFLTGGQTLNIAGDHTETLDYFLINGGEGG